MERLPGSTRGLARGATLIRSARPADAPAVAAIHIRSWQHAYRGQLPEEFLDDLTAGLDRRVAYWEEAIRASGAGRSTVMVAEDNGAVVGFVACGRVQGDGADGGRGEVYAIYLDPAHWGEGHGRSLLQSATEHLKAEGFTEAILWVLASNDRARRFYDIAGWRPDGATKTERWGAVVLNEVRYQRPIPSS